MPRFYYEGSKPDDTKNVQCAVCHDTRRSTQYANCDQCKLWYQFVYLNINAKDYKATRKTSPPSLFSCKECQAKNKNTEGDNDTTTMCQVFENPSSSIPVHNKENTEYAPTPTQAHDQDNTEYDQYYAQYSFPQPVGPIAIDD